MDKKHVKRINDRKKKLYEEETPFSKFLIAIGLRAEICPICHYRGFKRYRGGGEEECKGCLAVFEVGGDFLDWSDE